MLQPLGHSSVNLVTKDDHNCACKKTWELGAVSVTSVDRVSDFRLTVVTVAILSFPASLLLPATTCSSVLGRLLFGVLSVVVESSGLSFCSVMFFSSQVASRRLLKKAGRLCLIVISFINLRFSFENMSAHSLDKLS